MTVARACALRLAHAGSVDAQNQIEVLPGETRLVNLTFAPGANYTLNATEPGEAWYVCPLGTHCRLVSGNGVVRSHATGTGGNAHRAERAASPRVHLPHLCRGKSSS